MRVHPLISRRDLLKRGTSVAGAVLLARTVAAESLPLITKPIPSSGERMPVIGLGTIWYRSTQYAALRQLLERMQVLGGTVVDTAAAYGESEEVIGRALADGVGGAASFDRSLARLRTSYLDLLQVHSMSGTDELLPLLVQWKQAKRIRYLWVTTSSPDQHAAVVAAMQRYPLQFLLKYVASHPAVTCAIPGSLHLEHLVDNQGAGRGRLPDAAARTRMERLWDGLVGKPAAASLDSTPRHPHPCMA